MFLDDMFNMGGLKNLNAEGVYILNPQKRHLEDTLDSMSLRFILDASKDKMELEVFNDVTGRSISILSISSVGSCCGSVVLHNFSTDSLYNIARYGDKPCYINVDSIKVITLVMDVLLSCGYTNVVYYCAEWQTVIKKLLVSYGFKPINKFYNNRSGNDVELLCFDFPKIENEEDEEDEDY